MATSFAASNAGGRVADLSGGVGKEGRWGLGFGVVLGALALVAGTYVPQTTAMPALTPTAIIHDSSPRPNSLESTPMALASPLASEPTPMASAVPTNTVTAGSTPRVTSTVTTNGTLSATSTVAATSTFTAPARPTAAPIDSRTMYTVVPGDTLYDIAAKFGVTPQEISSANGITDPDRLKDGQRLIIPVGAAE